MNITNQLKVLYIAVNNYQQKMYSSIVEPHILHTEHRN